MSAQVVSNELRTKSETVQTYQYECSNVPSFTFAIHQAYALSPATLSNAVNHCARAMCTQLCVAVTVDVLTQRNPCITMPCVTAQLQQIDTL